MYINLHDFLTDEKDDNKIPINIYDSIYLLICVNSVNLICFISVLPSLVIYVLALCKFVMRKSCA